MHPPAQIAVLPEVDPRGILPPLGTVEDNPMGSARATARRILTAGTLERMPQRQLLVNFLPELLAAGGWEAARELDSDNTLPQVIKTADPLDLVQGLRLRDVYTAPSPLQDEIRERIKQQRLYGKNTARAWAMLYGAPDTRGDGPEVGHIPWRDDHEWMETPTPQQWTGDSVMKWWVASPPPWPGADHFGAFARALRERIDPVIQPNWSLLAELWVAAFGPRTMAAHLSQVDRGGLCPHGREFWSRVVVETAADIAVFPSGERVQLAEMLHATTTREMGYLRSLQTKLVVDAHKRWLTHSPGGFPLPSLRQIGYQNLFGILQIAPLDATTTRLLLQAAEQYLAGNNEGLCFTALERIIKAPNSPARDAFIAEVAGGLLGSPYPRVAALALDVVTTGWSLSRPPRTVP